MFLARTSIFKAASKATLRVGGLGLDGGKSCLLQPPPALIALCLSSLSQHMLFSQGQGSREGKMEKWDWMHRRRYLSSVVRLRSPGSSFTEFSCSLSTPQCSWDNGRDSWALRLRFSLSHHSAALGKRWLCLQLLWLYMFIQNFNSQLPLQYLIKT